MAVMILVAALGMWFLIIAAGLRVLGQLADQRDKHDGMAPR